MALTDYHAQYLAYELTKRCSSDKLEKLTGTFAGAQVELNPHQVDAALFAFRSPLSKGALLADEVGLGKTIEAGLVIAQKWAERRRKILIITPASLRKQWLLEMNDKFFLSGKILETKSYNTAQKDGSTNPFLLEDKLIICSYQFARNKAEDVAAVDWNLVVIDEAHRLRNVYKSSNVIANKLRDILRGKHKLLLTATPLQNSLLELYGLVSFIDERAFGDLKSFREQFVGRNRAHSFEMLRARLKPICHRTLRHQVTPYVRFTNRIPMVEEFTPEEAEERLHNLVSAYLQRDNLQALPNSQRSLMTLVLRKLLASSTYAIAGALNTMADRLRDYLTNSSVQQNKELTISQGSLLDGDYEALDETVEEWGEEDPDKIIISEVQKVALEEEIAELEGFAKLAVSVEHNAKGEALIKILSSAFKETMALGGAQKAIIFTESRRTQDYLLQRLSTTEWSEGILLFNGSNTDDKSKQIYKEWMARHQGTDLVTKSRTADMRAALVDYFREQGSIMIATEAAAEGINLQFCSLIINYDLPWNPQRIEQRIGRCHRYGQDHDVVVVNFLNKKNAADKRVFQLLNEKFKLFEGVFGSSDEVLGAIGSGVDFEKRISQIYQDCRRPEDIEKAFDALQQELSSEISEAMTQTRQKVLENFDDDVRQTLQIRNHDAHAARDRFEELLMQLTQHELADKAEFDTDKNYRFRLGEKAATYFTEVIESEEIPTGLYELPRRSRDAHTYRLGHPLADAVIEHAKTQQLATAEIQFEYGEHEGKITILEERIGQSGVLALSLLTVEALAQAEDHLIFAMRTDAGEVLDGEIAKKLMSLPGQVSQPTVEILPEEEHALEEAIRQRQSVLNQEIVERNADFFEAEVEKLDAWAEDRKVVLERKIKEFDQQIRAAKRAATGSLDLQAKLAGQKRVRDLEKQRNQKRRSLFDAQDEVDAQRDDLINNLEQQLEQRSELKRLFTIRWKLVDNSQSYKARRELAHQIW